MILNSTGNIEKQKTPPFGRALNVTVMKEKIIEKSKVLK
jgi:hypothetical protein